MQSSTLSRPLTTAHPTIGGDNDRRRTRSTRIRAILAGGLVLGLGAAVTLAAWNDSEFASGAFATGSFDMRGSLNGSTFTDHASSGAAALSFSVNPSTLTPNDTVYAPYAVRLMANTALDANVALSMTTTGSVANLSYTIISPGTWGCSSSTTGTSVVTSTAVGTTPGGTVFTLPQGTGGADGAIKYLCFAVTAGAGIAQNQSGTVTWDLTAQSTP
jgi:predicted ribosomally synthesized peptide with SipW-like signal peptide